MISKVINRNIEEEIIRGIFIEIILPSRWFFIYREIGVAKRAIDIAIYKRFITAVSKPPPPEAILAGFVSLKSANNVPIDTFK